MFSGLRSRWMMPAACADDERRRETGARSARPAAGVRRAVPLDALRERLAVEVLHDHEAVAVRQRPEVEHLEDVIVADLPGGLRLALEAPDDVGVGRASRRAAP